MDFADFKAKIAKSRELEVEVDGAKFRLLVPSEHAWRIAVEENRGPGGKVLQQRVSRHLLEASVVGWGGLLARHLLSGGGEEPVPFTHEARSILLDERQDIADELTLKLMQRLNERRAELETARKN